MFYMKAYPERSDLNHGVFFELEGWRRDREGGVRERETVLLMDTSMLLAAYCALFTDCCLLFVKHKS